MAGLIDLAGGDAGTTASLSVLAVLVLVALGLAAYAVHLHRRLTGLSDAHRDLMAERDAAVAALEAPVQDTEPDIEAVPFPVCVFSRAGHPERVNQAFMEWHGGDRIDALPAGGPALGRLRLLVARHALGKSAETDLGARTGSGPSLEWLGAVTMARADGGADEFVVALTHVAVGESDVDWLVLVPAHEPAGGRFSPVVEQAPVGIAVIDRRGRVADANQAMLDLLDRPRDRVLKRGFDGFVHEADREAWNDLLGAAARAAIDDGRQGSELRVGDPAMSYVSAFTRQRPGEQTTVVYMIDISSRRVLEDRIAETQKMQAVGQLAGGIAHDFNNLLTAMTGFCDLLLLRHRPGDPSFADIMQIKQNSNRAANLVRQLLAFSRQQTLIPRVLDITETLADLSHLLRRLIGEDIDLRITHGRNLHPVKVDQSQLEQVVVNLVVNARDALGGRGMIRMRTYNVTVDVPTRTRDEVMPPGKYVLIEVSDSGEGIAEENLDRIFEPFFSTKEIGSGTGLGLSTVYGIVKQTGGFVFVESTVGAGTKFSIYLPAHDGETDSATESEDPERVAPMDLTGVGTILLVEDEDPVRLFGARALRGKGYRVIEARSGETALAMLEDEGDAVDLLVTDVMMPGMDGPSLIRRVREMLPEIRVICISGYSEDALRQRISEDFAIHFLPKPFSLQQLAGKVKEVLEA